MCGYRKKVKSVKFGPRGGYFTGGGDYFNNHSPHHRYVPHCRDPVYFRHSSHLV